MGAQRMLSQLKPVVVITCVNYWDYLRVTLPYTVKFASKIYVVTTPDQDVPEDTQRNVDIIRTHAFSFENKVFNKSAAIRETQEMVHATHPNEWILLLDADIVVESDLCHDVECKDTLYGVTRLDYLTPEDFKENRATPYHVAEAGYFQLYFDKSKVYPESSEDASECDMEFHRNFDKHRVTGGAVYHLGQHTINWNGRISRPWKT